MVLLKTIPSFLFSHTVCWLHSTVPLYVTALAGCTYSPLSLDSSSSPASSSFPPSTFLSIPIFLSIFCFPYYIYLFINFSFLLFHICVVPSSSCLALGIDFTFPGCCTSEYHAATTVLPFPPATLTLHQPYWLGSCLLTPITPQLSLYKPHTKSYQLSSWISWPLQMGLIGCPKTSVRNYQQTPRNISEECKSYLLCSRSLGHACFTHKTQIMLQTLSHDKVANAVIASDWMTLGHCLCVTLTQVPPPTEK